MIALDTSALVAIAREEPGWKALNLVIARESAVIGCPTLVEAGLVLASVLPSTGRRFLDEVLARPSISAEPFTEAMFRLAAQAFDRYGKGQRHPAQLNFGDCLSYAVAKSLRLPLLYVGNDFAHTDISPAWRP